MGVSVVAKRFLNAWNFIILILGFALLLITLYILLFQSDTYAIPKVGYWSAIVCSGLLILLAALGLYGLRQQRVCVTRNKRNYALGIYCLCGFITGVVLVMAGSMALKFNVVINDSKALAFVQKAEVFLEEAIIDNLNDFASAEPAKWKKTQDSWFCCGYFDVPSVQNHIGLKYINMAKKINGIQGIYCSSNCTVNTSNTTQIITSTTSNTSPSQLVCPQVGASWCREVFLDNAETNNVYVGWVAIVGGSSQLLGFLLGMFLLLCDVRMMRLATMQPNVMEQAIKNAQT